MTELDLKKHLQQINMSYAKTMESIKKLRGATESEKREFTKRINEFVKENDAQYIKLKDAFLNKENDILSLWYLLKVSSSIIAVVEFKDETKKSELLEIISSLPIGKINELYDAMIYRKSIKNYYMLSNNLNDLRKLVDGKSNGYMLVLTFVNTIFDGTEVAKETISQTETLLGEVMEEEIMEG